MVKSNLPIALGIDIGGQRIKSTALSLSGEVLAEHRIDSDAKYGPEAVRKAVGRLRDIYAQEGFEFCAAGVGCAGSVDPRTGMVLNSPNFADWKDIPLQDWIAEDMSLPVTVENDANCAMFTEWKLGNAKGTENAILLTFGTGIGGGLIINGNLYRGSTGTGGELGHFSLHCDGIECNCGNRGCFERYCSASALEKKLPGHTAKEIFSRANEQPYKETLDRFFIDLMIGVTSLANIFDPDVILFGGGLFPGITSRLTDIDQWIRKHAFPAVAKHVRLMPTKYANQSGSIGAALLAFERAKIGL